jgi:hypothetical protein
MAGRALINADEDMLLKLRHLLNLTNFERFVAETSKSGNLARPASSVVMLP